MGFDWTEVDNVSENVIAFRRISPATGKEIISVSNFSPVVREGHRLGLPRAGTYKQLLNTDHEKYCGGGVGGGERIKEEEGGGEGLGYLSWDCFFALVGRCGLGGTIQDA